LKSAEIQKSKCIEEIFADDFSGTLFQRDQIFADQWRIRDIREDSIPRKCRATRYSTFFCTILNKVVKQKKSSRAVENSEPRLPKVFIFTVLIGEYVFNSVADRSLLTLIVSDSDSSVAWDGRESHIKVGGMLY